MPRFFPNVLDATIRCYYLNVSLPIPRYGVIYDPSTKRFAVTAVEQFRLWRATNPQSPIHLSIFMPNADLLVLWGQAPPPPPPTPTKLFMSLPPEAPASSDGNGDGA